jgi:hypothetical protein
MNYDDLPDWSFSDCYTGPYWSDCKIQTSVKKGKNRPRSKLEYHSKRHDERYATDSSHANRYDADVEYYQNTRDLSYLPRFIGTIPLRFNHNKLRGSNSHGSGRNKIIMRGGAAQLFRAEVEKEDKRREAIKEHENLRREQQDRTPFNTFGKSKPATTVPISEPVVAKPTVYTGTCLPEPQQTYEAGGYRINNSNLSDIFRGRRSRRRRKSLM